MLLRLKDASVVTVQMWRDYYKEARRRDGPWLSQTDLGVLVDYDYYWVPDYLVAEYVELPSTLDLQEKEL